MYSLFIVQAIIMALLIFSFYRLKIAKKRLASGERNYRNFAASILEHEERMRLKFKNSLKKIIQDNENPESNKDVKKKLKQPSVLNELFNFADELTPFNPAADTLVTAIEKLIKTNKTKNLRISFFSDPNKNVIPTATGIIIYRIIKEAISNAKKHSLANKIFISLLCENNMATVSVEDNGRGFDTNKATTGTGLQAISKAINFLNGKIEIQSHRNKGTILSAQVPLNQ